MRSHSLAIVLLCTVPLISAALLCGADWPGYRGANQDGISPDTLSWPSGGPKVAWKSPTPTGFSSFAVGGGKVFTQVVHDKGGPREVCLALDAATGKELWTAEVGVGKGYSGGGEGDGPRSTPAYSDGMVYVYSPNMVLFCFDAASGKTVWSHDISKEHAGQNIQWRSAASPVVDGDLVFVYGGGAGQSLLAFHKKKGSVAWKSEDQTMTHAMPVTATIGGVRQVIFFCKSGLVSAAADSGKTLWKFPFDFKTSTAASPVVSGDIVYCSAGYDVGAAACKISKSGDKFTATQLWRTHGNKPVANHWSTPVIKDGYLYGMFSFKEFGKGPVKCVELTTGKVKWEQAGFGAGNLILVGDKLLALADDGQVVIAEARPDAYKEVGRFKAVAGKCWSTPAWSDGCIFVRSTKEGACLALGAK